MARALLGKTLRAHERRIFILATLATQPELYWRPRSISRHSRSIYSDLMNLRWNGLVEELMGHPYGLTKKSLIIYRITLKGLTWLDMEVGNG